MNLLPIIQHEYFEILIPAGTVTSRIPFPDIHKLRYANLRGIEIYTDYELGLGLNGYPVLPQSNTVDSFITLTNVNGKAFVDRRYTSLFYPDNPLDPYASRYPKDFVGQVVNWPKSYIEFVNPLVTGITQTLAISVYYSNHEEIVDEGIMTEYVNDVQNTRSMPLIKQQYTEIVIPKGTISVLNFPIIENLREVYVRGLEVITNLTANFSYSGLPVANVNDLNQSWVNLQYYNGLDFVQRMNTARLYTGDFGANNFSKIQPRGLAKPMINWNNCTIEFIPALEIDSEVAIPINIYYEDDEVVELKDELYEFSNKL